MSEQLNIYQLYESVIGPVPGAVLADELADAERTYPAEWIRDAFKEAAVQNARRWAYVRAILQRWRDSGKAGGAKPQQTAADRYRSGEYGQVVRWR